MSILAAAGDYLPFLPKAAPRFVTEEGHRVHGMVAEFTDTPTVYHAAEMIRDAGYKKWDVNSPFPIHGMEEAMGIKKTILPYIVFQVGIGGALVGWLMQYWMSAIDYEIVVQGKPFGAWEPFVPIIFELGVLHAAFAALLSMLMLNGLPRWNHPLFSHDRFLTTGEDTFVIGIESDDPSFDPEATRALLEKAGGTNIDLIEDRG